MNNTTNQELDYNSSPEHLFTDSNILDNPIHVLTQPGVPFIDTINNIFDDSTSEPSTSQSNVAFLLPKAHSLSNKKNLPVHSDTSDTDTDTSLINFTNNLLNKKTIYNNVDNADNYTTNSDIICSSTTPESSSFNNYESPNYADNSSLYSNKLTLYFNGSCKNSKITVHLVFVAVAFKFCEQV